MFKLRYPLIAIASALFGAVAAVGVYMYYVPLPKDAMARGAVLRVAEERAWLNGAMTEIFPTRAVAPAVDAAPLPVAEGALEGFSFAHEGEPRTITDLYDSQAMLGLVVVKDGAIVHESYAPGHGPATLFTTWSVVKSMTSTLVGLAIEAGLIDSEADLLSRYLPEVRGTAYDGVTIAQAMQMSSGVNFDLGSGEDTVAFVTDGPVTGKRTAYEIALSHERGAAPGTRFSYNTAETQVLLELVRRVSGQTAADFTAERLWQPLGMRFHGAWVLDAAGQDGAEIGGALFNAALRDWARFGWFIAQDGVWDGERLLPEGWVDRATASDQAHINHGTVHSDKELGYGYQWWTRADGTFQAQGAYGQLIYVDRANGLVVAKASAWARPRDMAHFDETTAMVRALGAWDFGAAGDRVASGPEASEASETGETIPASTETAGPDGATPAEAALPDRAEAETVPADAAAAPTPDTAPETTTVPPPPSVAPEAPAETAASAEVVPQPPVQAPGEGMGVAESRFIDPDDE